MTDEQIKPLPAPSASAESTTESKAATKAKAKNVARLSGSARTVLALTLILALAAAGGAGFLLYWTQLKQIESLQEMTTLKADLNDRTNQITQLRNDLQQASGQLQQDRSAIQKANTSRDDLAARMAALEKQIAVVTGSHRIDWMLKEIEHFIMLAERRVSLLGDAQGALALMQEADTIARDLNEPVARNLREALTKDIHNLKMAAETSVDVDGIFLRISGLVDRVPKLNIPRYELYQTPPDDGDGGMVPDEGFALFLHRFGEFMTSLVRYQKHEKQKPVLLTAQRDYLAQSIMLLLEQGQLALLRGDNNAYRLSLKETRDRVDAFLQLQDKETKLFINELDSLATITLRPQMPSLENSVRAVQVFREFWAKEKVQREQAVLKLETQQADLKAAEKAKAKANANAVNAGAQP